MLSEHEIASMRTLASGTSVVSEAADSNAWLQLIQELQSSLVTTMRLFRGMEDTFAVAMGSAENMRELQALLRKQIPAYFKLHKLLSPLDDENVTKLAAETIAQIEKMIAANQKPW